jgi:hypothetical protein
MSSPRSKLHAKLADARAARTTRTRGADPTPKQRKTPQDTTSRLALFPEWLTRQLVRAHPEVVHSPNPFMLLFRIDMEGDPLVGDSTVHVGTRLDVMLVRVNGGIYYLSSTHMDGLQKRVPRNIRVTPAQLLYVYSPSTHTKNASADVTVNVEALHYVSTVPARWVREDREWDMPLVPELHLPAIRAVDELPA